MDKKRKKNYSTTKILLIITCFFFILLPFFWMKPGEIDLGGDGTRLYFYDPINYIKSTLSYTILPLGFGNEENYFSVLPFVSILALLKVFITSYFLVSIINGLKLVFGFLAIYGIIFNLLNKRNSYFLVFLAAYTSGMFYILSPIATHSGWDLALIPQNQLFLNPSMFYLFLRFNITNKSRYLYLAILLSGIFAGNFGFVSAPGLFAYYPLTILFLISHKLYVLNQKIEYKRIIIAFLLFISLHAFHLIPTVLSLLNKSGTAYQRAFTSQGQFEAGLNYFLSVSQVTFLSKNLLIMLQYYTNGKFYQITSIIIPLIIICGLILMSQKKIEIQIKKNYLLILAFFLVSIYLTSAKITEMGFTLYQWFFHIPGFSMFRNYYGQWMFLFLFYASLLFGLSFYIVAINFKNNRYPYYISLFTVTIIVILAIPFFKGDLSRGYVNKGGKKQFTYFIIFDHNYPHLLNQVRHDNKDGKYVSFPFTDYYDHLIAGTQGGMYMGPSIISALDGKSDFAGYELMVPFSDIFLDLVKQKDYQSIGILFSLLNIKSVYYNQDPLILDDIVDYPYNYVSNYFPKKQSDYKKLVNALPIKKQIVYGNKYGLYQVTNEFYLPHIYTPTSIMKYKPQLKNGYFAKPFFTYANGYNLRTAYITNTTNIPTNIDLPPKISFTKVNPTKYYIHIEKIKKPFILVFSESYNQNWQLFLKHEDKKDKQLFSYFNGDIIENIPKNLWIYKDMFETFSEKPIANINHFQVNGYANGWYVTPTSIGNTSNATLVLEMVSQKYYYISLFISIVAFVVTLFAIYITCMRKSVE